MRRRVFDALAVVAGLALSAGVAAHGAHDDALDFRQAPRDALPWGMLSKVGLHREEGRFVPRFLPPLLALNGRRVTLFGYMTGKPGRKLQQRFLLSPRPLLCGDRDPLGPQEIVEVVLDRGIAATDKPLAVRGTLTLLQASPDGLLFRLEHGAPGARTRAR